MIDLPESPTIDVPKSRIPRTVFEHVLGLETSVWKPLPEVRFVKNEPPAPKPPKEPKIKEPPFVETLPQMPHPLLDRNTMNENTIEPTQQPEQVEPPKPVVPSTKIKRRPRQPKVVTEQAVQAAPPPPPVTPPSTKVVTAQAVRVQPKPTRVTAQAVKVPSNIIQTAKKIIVAKAIRVAAQPTPRQRARSFTLRA